MKLLVVLALVGVAVAELDVIQEAQKLLMQELNMPKVIHAGKGLDLSIPSMEDFEDFLNRHGKSYEAEEKKVRHRHYQINMFVARMLQMFEKGTATYGETPFSDLSLAEFRKFYKNGGMTWRETGLQEPMPEMELQAIPDSYDWRDHNAVTPVKNQGQCGSCWAFSTTGNIEGQWAIKKGSLVSLSEQELVDCDKVDEGCNGGLPSQAYKVIEQLGGLETEKAYAYTGRDGKCQFSKSKVSVYINDSKTLPEDEQQLAQFVATQGPISIGINAFAMQFYSGGISNPWSIFCSPSKLDHGVLIVGYGTENGTPFWVIKNSWGPSWGEKGYYRIVRGKGACGLNKMATTAVVA